MDELAVWRLDQEINARGVAVDSDTVLEAIKLMREYRSALLGKLREVTHGAVQTGLQVQALLAWLHSRGVKLPDLCKDTVAQKLREPLPDDVKTVLEIRQKLSRSSIAKYQALLDRTCDDGRVRDLFCYWGAATGRWSGRGFQPQNLPRGRIASVDHGISLINQGDIELIELFHGELPDVLSSCLRGVLVAEEGKRFLCADFSSIEARVLAWLAGEDDLLEAFSSGADVYQKTADKLGITRQVAKVLILACGYQGHVGAFQALARNYGVAIADDEAANIVNAWRNRHPYIVSLWHELEEKTKATIKTGRPRALDKLKWRIYKKEWAQVVLPSGRPISYYQPRVDEDGGLSYMSMGFNKKWERTETYGGKLVENVCQGIARDLLAEALLRIESAGYPIVMHVHDEIVSEAYEDFGSLEEFGRIMSATPAWAAGLPVAVSGWEGRRYRK